MAVPLNKAVLNKILMGVSQGLAAGGSGQNYSQTPAPQQPTQTTQQPAPQQPTQQAAPQIQKGEIRTVNGKQYQWQGAQWALYNPTTGKASQIATRDVAAQLATAPSSSNATIATPAAKQQKVAPVRTRTVKKQVQTAPIGNRIKQTLGKSWNAIKGGAQGALAGARKGWKQKMKESKVLETLATAAITGQPISREEYFVATKILEHHNCTLKTLGLRVVLSESTRTHVVIKRI